MSKFDKARNLVMEKKFATYTLKISEPLFTKFKIKSLTDKHATYRETLTNLIEEYVRT